LYNGYSFRLVESRQIEKIWLLVEFVEHSSRTVLCV
jgi:hypothetical protein